MAPPELNTFSLQAVYQLKHGISLDTNWLYASRFQFWALHCSCSFRSSQPCEMPSLLRWASGGSNWRCKSIEAGNFASTLLLLPILEMFKQTDKSLTLKWLLLVVVDSAVETISRGEPASSCLKRRMRFQSPRHVQLTAAMLKTHRHRHRDLFILNAVEDVVSPCQ